MTLKPFPFQSDAIRTLVNHFAVIKNVSEKQNINMKDYFLLNAPTGSGKTLMLVKSLDKISREFPNKYSFVWLTPGTGGLDDQSRIKASHIVSNMQADNMQSLNDSLKYGFNADTITFIDWESVNSKKNIAQINGTLNDRIDTAKQIYNLKFIIVIDEEHIAKETDKSKNVLNKFGAIETFLASATPNLNQNIAQYNVYDATVEQQGLITSDIYINDHLLDNQNINLNNANSLSFLEAADNKRKEIKDLYLHSNDSDSQINPLVLIQLPDKSDNVLRPSLNNIIDNLHQINQSNNEIAIRLSQKKKNLDNIESNHSPINYLIMKHAVSLGWDAPRAKILVTLRLNMKGSFAIQTIGRIRRMPEHKSYKEHLLNSCFIYSNDQDYVTKVLNSKNFNVESNQLKLKNKVNRDIFGIKSIKPGIKYYNNGGKVAQHFYFTFKNQYNLQNNAPINNLNKLKNAGFIFNNKFIVNLKAGHSNNLDQLDNDSLLDMQKSEDLNSSTNRMFYRYESLYRLKRYFGLKITEIYDILINIFTNDDHYGEYSPLLDLNCMEATNFFIINHKRIEQVASQMHNKYNDIQLNWLMDNANNNYYDFYLPNPDAYKQNDKNTYPKEMKKNIYQGYNTNYIDAKQSNPERMFEFEIENISAVEYIYRSKDHGGNYFSIPYRAGRDFYPDYLVKDKNDITYIIEIKGGENIEGEDSNIDTEALYKFKALKYYVNYMSNKLCKNRVKFAFVRPRKSGELVYSDTNWKESLNDSTIWRPLNELFKR